MSSIGSIEASIEADGGPRATRDAPEGDLALPDDLGVSLPEVEERSTRPVVLERPTLEGLEALIRGLNDKTVDAATLDTPARRAVVAFLAEGRGAGKDGKPGKLVTRDHLARLLKVSTSKIAADLAAIRRAAGARLMKKWGVETAIGFLERTAEDCYREARELGDPALAWMIRSNFVKQLKELGAFGGGREEAAFKVTFESVGPNLANLTRKLEDAFRPELTGERIVEGRALPLPQKLEGEELPRPAVSPPDGGETEDDLPGLVASGEPPEDSETIEGQ